MVSACRSGLSGFRADRVWILRCGGGGLRAFRVPSALELEGFGFRAVQHKFFELAVQETLGVLLWLSFSFLKFGGWRVWADLGGFERSLGVGNVILSSCRGLLRNLAVRESARSSGFFNESKWNLLQTLTVSYSNLSTNKTLSKLVKPWEHRYFKTHLYSLPNPYSSLCPPS